MVANCRYTLGNTLGKIPCHVDDFISAETQGTYFSYCGCNNLATHCIIFFILFLIVVYFNTYCKYCKPEGILTPLINK